MDWCCFLFFFFFLCFPLFFFCFLIFKIFFQPFSLFLLRRGLRRRHPSRSPVSRLFWSSFPRLQTTDWACCLGFFFIFPFPSAAFTRENKTRIIISRQSEKKTNHIYKIIYICTCSLMKGSTRPPYFARG